MAACLRDETEAANRIKEDCQWTSDPALSADEITRLLSRARIATVHATGTAYPIGSLVVPAVSNGRMYESVMGADGAGGGTSGATPPDWPYRDRWPYGQSEFVTDGDVIFRDAGPEPPALWDLRYAAYLGWTMKAGKVGGSGKLTAGKLSADENQAHTQCLEMARRFAPVGFV